MGDASRVIESASDEIPLIDVAGALAGDPEALQSCAEQLRRVL